MHGSHGTKEGPESFRSFSLKAVTEILGEYKQALKSRVHRGTDF